MPWFRTVCAVGGRPCFWPWSTGALSTIPSIPVMLSSCFPMWGPMQEVQGLSLLWDFPSDPVWNVWSSSWLPCWPSSLSQVWLYMLDFQFGFGESTFFVTWPAGMLLSSSNLGLAWPLATGGQQPSLSCQASQECPRDAPACCLFDICPLLWV